MHLNISITAVMVYDQSLGIPVLILYDDVKKLYTYYSLSSVQRCHWNALKLPLVHVVSMYTSYCNNCDALKNPLVLLSYEKWERDVV